MRPTAALVSLPLQLALLASPAAAATLVLPGAAHNRAPRHDVGHRPAPPEPDRPAAAVALAFTPYDGGFPSSRP